MVTAIRRNYEKRPFDLNLLQETHGFLDPLTAFG
jgi:hypothetical protein